MAGSEILPASSTFKAFLAHGIDRCAYIGDWLRAREIPHSVIELAGKRHIVVKFAPESYDPRYRMKTLVAHYDRAAGTPGANDNSAACFQLMLLAERLCGEPAGEAHNVRIFFTDGEEAAGTQGISGQGAFALGEGLRKLRMTDDDVYVFDACGRGDALVLSTAGMDRRLSGGLAKRLTALHSRAASIAQGVSPDRWMSLPTPYSDNAGFLAAGIASQVITVLPRGEAERLSRAARLFCATDAAEKFLGAIVANKASKAAEAYADSIPDTWKLMHTPEDDASSLTASAFALMGRFLEALARFKAQ